MRGVGKKKETKKRISLMFFLYKNEYRIFKLL
jgi:hypothetical protein